MACKMILLAVLALKATALQVRTEAEAELELGNPAVQKVVNMLREMQKEVEKEGEEEAKIFDKALCACEGGEEHLKKVIAHSGSEVARLTSEIDADTAEKAKLKAELAAHKQDQASSTKSLEEATNLRQKEAKKWQDDDMMNRFSINSITQAVRLFEKEGSAAAFVQANPKSKDFRRVVEVSRFLTPTKREKVLEFLDAGSAGSFNTAETSAGVSQIIGILKGMKDEITKNTAEAKTEEGQAVDDFNGMKEAKLEHLGTLMQTIADKTKRSGHLAKKIIDDKINKNQQENENQNAINYLSNMAEECATKSKERDTRATMRANEVEAIGQAIAILTNDEARDSFKATGQMLQLTKLRPTADFEALVEVSKNTAAKPHKGLLLAQGPDGMEMGSMAEKVVDHMITNMVEVLHNDDVNDEHKKEWCANETEAYYQLNQEKTRLAAQLTASIEETSTQLEETKDQIKFLEESIATLDKEVTTATAQRKTEHTEFVNTFATMETARRLIDKAGTRLQQFYNPEHSDKKEKGHFEHRDTSDDYKNPAFLQVRSVQHVAPAEIPDTPTEYKKSGKGNGVIGLMNEIKAEMTVDMRESEVDEKYSAKDYVRQMHDAVEDRAANVKALHSQQSVKAQQEEKIMNDKESRRLTVKELEDIALYMIQLKNECDFLLANFDNRHGARIEEEVGLETAETIVTNAEPPSHGDTAHQFETEDNKAEVDEHFPDRPMPVLAA